MTLTVMLDAFQDLVDHLSDYSGGDSPLDRGLRDYRRASVQAYRDLALSNEWKAYLTRGRLTLNPLQDTGTIAFDLTGGTYERMVTLTDYTWPMWATYGTLLIDDVRYKIEDRKSSTVITLTEDSCPTADVAAGETYVLYQNVYELPKDFRRLDGAHFENGLGCLDELAGVPEWLHLDQQQPSSGRPYAFAIGGSPDSLARMSMYVHPYPDVAESFDFTYWRNPRPLYYTGYETEARAGTVAVSAGSTSVTGTSTTFSQKMVGSLIRFSRDATNYPDGSGGLTPFQEQRVIKSVESATALTLDSAVDFAYSGAKYVVTDPIDADGALLVALYRNAEKFLDNFRHPERVSNRERLYQKAWIEACERDQRLTPSFGLYGALWGGGDTLITEIISGDDDDDDDPGGGVAVPAMLFSQTSIETLYTSTTQTDISGTGEGSLTISGDTWDLADAIRVRASGTYGTKATTAGSLTLRLKWGSGLTQTFLVSTIPDAQSGKQWSLEATLTRHSVGPTGTVSGPGTFSYDVEGEPDSYSVTDNIANETLASDSSQVLSLTAQWSASDVANTITCSQLTVEQLGT